MRSSLLPVVLAALFLSACQSTGPIQTGDLPVSGEDSATLEKPTSLENDVPMYSAADYLDLVRSYAQQGGERVDYAGWQANSVDRARLNAFIDLLAQVSPESHPEQFPTPGSQRSYWINAYNALVLQAVLELWPLDSVRDVNVTLSSRVVPGKGFFYDRKVVVGGRETNLYKLEKEVLRNQRDPRLHFALNCASESCPVLRPSDWGEEDLDQAARDFVNQAENVAVVNGELRVSRIFKWYRKDFPDDLAAYLAQYAEPELAAQLEQASRQDLPLRYQDYDWSLNAEAADSAQDDSTP